MQSNYCPCCHKINLYITKMFSRFTMLVSLMVLFFVTKVTLSQHAFQESDIKCERKLFKCNSKLLSVTKLLDQLWNKYEKLGSDENGAENNRLRLESELMSAKYELEHGERRHFGVLIGCSSGTGSRPGFYDSRLVHVNCQINLETCISTHAERKNVTRKIKNDINDLKSRIKKIKQKITQMNAELADVNKLIAEKQKPQEKPEVVDPVTTETSTMTSSGDQE